MNIKEDIFALKIKQPSPKQGDLLISGPFLADEFFHRAAICLVDYDEDDSSMGLILNKKSRFTLQEAVDGIECDADIPLFIGGPVSMDRLFYMHTLGNLIPGSKEFYPGLYINGDLRIIKSYINSGERTKGIIRFFAGYSAWEPLQLNQELDNNVWGVLRNNDSDELLLGCGNRYWTRMVGMMGNAYRRWMLCPKLPNMN